MYEPNISFHVQLFDLSSILLAMVILLTQQTSAGDEPIVAISMNAK
jgi:hypothetical protein